MARPAPCQGLHSLQGLRRTVGSVSRTRDDDACPGALQVHRAADGALARIRLPGGIIRAEQLAALADAAERFGSATLELTTRGNVQIRGIAEPEAVAEAVAEAGLLPSPTHERVRNIVASPLSGRVGGLTDVRDWVGELDRALQADPVLAALPGRFWFSIDDGTGDVSGVCSDAGLHVMGSATIGGQERSDPGIDIGGQERSDPGIDIGGQERSDPGVEGVALLLAGVDTGVRLSPSDGVPALIEVARRFVDLRGKAWRVRELDDPAPLLARLTPVAPAGWRFTPGRPPVGWIDQADGRVALGAAVPLGVLSARQAHFLAAVEAPVVITPWRSVLVCDLSEGVADTALRVLAPMGLVFDDTSPWLRISACVGSPGCERSRADVRAAAARAAASDDGAGHYVGCERACGSPLSGPVLVATGEGFQTLDRPTVG